MRTNVLFVFVWIFFLGLVAAAQTSDFEIIQAMQDGRAVCAVVGTNR